jgi:PKD repeat protein
MPRGRTVTLALSLLAALVVPGPGRADVVVWLGLPAGGASAWRSTGGGGAWTRVAALDLPDVGYNAFPALADLDGDGDADALVGESQGGLFAFANDGTNGTPRWRREPLWDVPGDFGSLVAPALGDVDRDGDADLLLGNARGDVLGLENVGGRTRPAWASRAAWDLGDLGTNSRPALGDFDGDGRLDLVVGLDSGAIHAWAGTGTTGTPFARRDDWDAPGVGDRAAPAFGDLDGDGLLDLLVEDGSARSTVYRNAGGHWTAAAGWGPADPGGGPAAPALLGRGGGGTTPPTTTPTTTPPTTLPPSGNRAPTARLQATPASGAPPLAVRLDAGASTDPEGDPLSFVWELGDGSSSAPPPADPAAAITFAAAVYDEAKATRDAGHYEDAVATYLADVDVLLTLVGVAVPGPLTVQGTNRIDRVARWYLQKIGHDLGGIYLFHSVGLSLCERYARSLQYSRESAAQAVAGGFPQLPSVNGTDDNIAAAVEKLLDRGCPVPAPTPMFSPRMGGGPVVTHTYGTAGTYAARVTVSDGRQTASATVTIAVGQTTPPPPPPPPGGGDAEGFGAATPGGAGGRVVEVAEATDAAVRRAFDQARTGHAQVVFRTAGPIAIERPLPRLEGAFITLEGNGVTLDGSRLSATAPLVDVRGHDVIVRNMRLRNGGDNLRIQDASAYNVLVSHVSSSGALDDGISIGYGAHDVTVQWCFLAGNTRSVFVKYKGTTNVSIHHTWIMKQWIRGPLISGSALADLRNVILEDWVLWGARFEGTSTGNVVDSLFREGPYADSLADGGTSALRATGDARIHTAGNAYAGDARPAAPGKAAVAFGTPPVTTQTVAEMTPQVERGAGCMPRDAVDQAYIDLATGWRTTESQPVRLP